MIRVLVFLIFAGLTSISPATAQQQVFIQIEAQPNLALAQRSLQRYADRFGDLNGFELTTGWFGIALGPYPEDEALRRLQDMRSARLIPSDSYIAQSSAFLSQFWPDGVTDLSRVRPADTQQNTAAPLDGTEAVAPSETIREARAGEARLSREERADIQKALAWAGFYQGSIDAAFGPGTRQAMSRWQEAQALPATGVLTTRQRADLLTDYNALLADLGLARIEDRRAGVALTLPTGLVEFARYEPPLAHYDTRRDTGADIDARVFLISQSGNRAALAGLYDVLQTLDIVPLVGPRQLSGDSFTITGQDDTRATHIEARLEGGQIKGFALVWPAGADGRRTRVLDIMQESFTRLDSVLDPADGSDGNQSIDLLAGLEIRQPLRTRSGFFVDPRGWVVTSADAVAGCSRVTLDGTIQAEVEALAVEAGLALLRPLDLLAPRRVATLAPETPRLRSAIAVSGYSYGGVLGAPSITFGTLADLKGLSGEPEQKRLALTALESDAGGPVLDDRGAVLGLLLPRQSSDRVLPDNVSFATGPQAITRLLSDAGITPQNAGPGPILPPETLRQQAAGMTVLVSCWD